MVLAQDLLEAQGVLFRVSYLQRVVSPGWKADIAHELRPDGAQRSRSWENGGAHRQGGLGSGREGHVRSHLVNVLGGEEAVFRAGGRSQRRQDDIDAPTRKKPRP